MPQNTKYQLHLKGFVGGYDFDADYVDYILARNEGKEVNVLIDSLGGQSNTALSIFSAFRRHGNVNVHFVGKNASAGWRWTEDGSRTSAERPWRGRRWE